MAVLSSNGYPRAGFFRRLGAFVYDLLLSLALVMLAGAIAVGSTALLHSINLISLGDAVDVAAYLDSQAWYAFYLLGCFCAFYVWFWHKAGQTLGMKAWRLRVQQLDGHNLTVTQCLVRLTTATVGLGNLLVIFDRGNLRAFQDYMSDSEMVVLPVRPKTNVASKNATEE